MKQKLAVRPAPKAPRLYYHKASGQGYVILNGRTVYLGKFDLPETQQKYHQLMAEWMAHGQQLPVAAEIMTVSEIIARFITHAENYYRRPDGQMSSEVASFRLALRPLRELYGSTKATDFGPVALKLVRQKMTELGWCRNYINHQVRRVKTAFKWAASEQLVPASVFHGLQTLDGLRRGRSNARESVPVKPVMQASIDAIRPFVSAQVWSIIQLQLFTAARPGELLVMRPCDIDRSGSIWVYRPVDHKTAYHGHERVIYIGPRLIDPYLTLARPQALN